MVAPERSPQSELALQAVRNSMSYVRSQFLADAKGQIGYMPKFTAAMTDEELVRERSKGNCDEGTSIALKNLLGSVHLFQRMGRVAAPQSVTHPFHDNYLFHEYFIAEDVTGHWYAGSPANADTNPGAFATILEADSLSEIMGKITIVDGGLWPESTEIEKTFTPNTKTSFPVFDRTKHTLTSPYFGVLNGQTFAPEKGDSKYSVAY